ncbi:MAG: ATP-binding cassette domain-containing protein [Deltaproteobacteria bacterium]|jgi:ATP-binding cassette subfamily F protein uup|nr:ATP-binding cassette domain-containing protein [Deltaproteobacteria bacterium]
MALISLQNVSLSFGGLPVLDRISMQIEPGERVCLVGRNGEGKSSLMRLIAGELPADSGRITRQQGVKIARLDQEVPLNLLGTVHSVVSGGVGRFMTLLDRHHDVSSRLADDGSAALLVELAAVDHEMEAAGVWQVRQQIDTVLSRLELDPDRDFAELSGGMKRRVLLARALVCQPDLLLLDEPTNHLDIESITWLEEFLLASSFTLLFVTHDRDLLKKLATRIMDLERGSISSWPGDYDTYLRRKEEMLSAENGQNARFDKKLAQEEVWVRQGIKARRTRNEGRVRALVEMRRQYQARRQQLGNVRMEITAAGLSGKLVAVLKDVSLGFGDRNVINKFSTTVLRGDRIGIIGPNGAGKTTLLRLLLGKLQPEAGQVRLGTNLLPVYFDQQRAQLDAGKTVIDNLGDGSDFVEINGRRRHIIGYLRDFLFAADRARSPVSILSGGERNRLLLAKLFARPSNVLVLDEPTNDLDIETLELLEDLLLEYRGTVLVVSHDRAFLNNVVTSTLVFEGEGRVQEYAGGYDDWLRQRPSSLAKKVPVREVRQERVKARPDGPRKLTFKETRELEELPDRIETLEQEQRLLYETMADEAFYRDNGGAAAAARAGTRLHELELLLQEAYSRWEELETVREEFIKK